MVVICMQSGKCIYCGASAEYICPGDDEGAVKPAVELVAAHHVHELVYVVRDIVGVLHRIALLEADPRGERVEILYELPVHAARTHQLGLRVEDELPALGES